VLPSESNATVGRDLKIIHLEHLHVPVTVYAHRWQIENRWRCTISGGQTCEHHAKGVAPASLHPVGAALRQRESKATVLLMCVGGQDLKGEGQDL
jgi:hypothetical protein